MKKLALAAIVVFAAMATTTAAAYADFPVVVDPEWGLSCDDMPSDACVVEDLEGTITFDGPNSNDFYCEYSGDARIYGDGSFHLFDDNPTWMQPYQDCGDVKSNNCGASSPEEGGWPGSMSTIGEEDQFLGELTMCLTVSYTQQTPAYINASLQISEDAGRLALEGTGTLWNMYYVNFTLETEEESGVDIQLPPQ